MVLSFCYLCYLGDCLSLGGSCEPAYIKRCHFARGKFKLLSILTLCSFPITSSCRVYSPCARSAMRHASEPWAPFSSAKWSMIHWMCFVITMDQVNSQDLLGMVQLDDVNGVFGTRRVAWHGHVELCDDWLEKKPETQSRRSGVRLDPSLHCALN